MELLEELTSVQTININGLLIDANGENFTIYHHDGLLLIVNGNFERGIEIHHPLIISDNMITINDYVFSTKTNYDRDIVMCRENNILKYIVVSVE